MGRRILEGSGGGGMVAKGCLPEQRLGAELVRGARGVQAVGNWALPERAQEAPLGATLALGFPRPSRSIVSAVGPLASTPRPGPVPFASFLFGHCPLPSHGVLC